METFGELIVGYRLRSGSTQQELADEAGVSVRALRDIERGGVHRPHARSVRRLAEVTGLDLAEVLGQQRLPPLRIDLLGPLTVRRHAEQLGIGSLMQRRLLGLLALQPNRVVPHEEIVDFLWGEDIPASYRNLVHTYVGRLRRFLAEHGDLLGKAGGGYRLALTTGHSDLARFTELTTHAAAHEADGEFELAEPAYDEALALWRGDVLADLGDRVRAHPVVVALTQRRLTAVLNHADIALRLGRHERALARLRAAANADPLHEGLSARLVLALAAAGQRAGGLRLYDEVRGHLAENLGIEPGPELRDAYLRVLRQDQEQAGPRRAGVVPAQLPPDIATFTGRGAELRALHAHLSEETRVAAAGIVVITGTAGVGKTALAVRWAHEVRDTYRDGQLYYDLRGHPDSAPRTTTDALAHFLQALGVSPAALPLDPDARVALFRSMLAGRRMLLFLDNARGSDQVRALVPANPHCAVVVTSRNDLSGLLVVHDALTIHLEVLPHEDAVALLWELLGTRALDTPPAIVDELARLCAHLPLALRIAAANVSRGGYATVAEYTTALREGNRLAALTAGDDTAVQAAFQLSYVELRSAAARLFRLLGLVPGADFDLAAAAALMDADPEDTARALDQLVGAHLVQRRGRDRYQFHDLLRLFAAQRCEQEHDRDERDRARQRLYDHYLSGAHQATDQLYPGMLRLCALPDGVPASSTSTPSPAEWLDAERGNLAAAVHHAAEHGPKAVTWQLTDVLRGHLWRNFDVCTWLAMAEAGLRAAGEEDDRTAMAAMHYSLGAAHRYGRSDHDAARRHLEVAQGLFRELGAPQAEAAALDSLGMVHHEQGRSELAVLVLEQSLELCRREGMLVGVTKVLCGLGFVEIELDRGQAAVGHLREALSTARGLPDRHLEATALHNLGLARQRGGRFEEARRDYRSALAIRQDIGDAEGTGMTLDQIGLLLHETGQVTAGRRYWSEALVILEKICHPRAEEIHARLTADAATPFILG